METKNETKVERLILRHLAGSKSGQTNQFELSGHTEITLGRNPASGVAYDPNHDDLVSTDHAKIVWDASEPNVFTLADLGSRNGTFVNNQRVNSPVRLKLGDLVQFGPDGPKWEFDCEPRSEGLIKTTRMAAINNAAVSAPVPPTRAGAGGAGFDPFGSGSLNAAPAINGNNTSGVHSHHGSPNQSGAPGRTTVWNMIANAQRQTRKQTIYGALAVVLLAGVLAWKFWPGTPVVAGGCGPKCVAEKFGGTTVKINVTWKLISPNGGLVYHQYVPNRKHDGDEQLIPGGPPYVALYVKVDKDTVEPYLAYDGNKFSVPIGGSHSGTGFFVSSNGFILTNRHVAAAWETIYGFPDSANVGIVYAADKKTILGVTRRAPDDWIPAKSQQEFGSFKGANDKLEVGLPGSSTPVRADLRRISDRHDVALIKMDMPEAAPMVELNDNYDTIKEGEAVTILGYPAVTSPVFGFIRNADDASRGAQTRVVIPKITVTPGNVGAVLRSSGEGRDVQVSRIGDVYQLTANATGAGNSGGPVFDDEGRVIGILHMRGSYGGASVTYAVPIRYGKELMSLK